MNRRHQQGIALVTTLIMLSVVTLMAIAFLAVSRRERATVAVSSDRLDSRAMAEMAYHRAEAELIARVLATTNPFNYDLLISTNLISTRGFQPNDTTNEWNVSYVGPNGQFLTGDDYLQNLRNLRIDPRPPVFVQTNTAPGSPLDFRFYIDLNRNGRFETNGLLFELNNSGAPVGITNFFRGDPEWLGVLRRPDLQHSGTNLFAGRYAYVVLPAGKSLDLNFVHNQAKAALGTVGPLQNGYLRNQGVGSWELNLAAFLRDLNTNAWFAYNYFTNRNQPSDLIAFDSARTLLFERYRTNAADLTPHRNLRSVQQLFGANATAAFQRDGNDGYGDGPLMFDVARPYTGTFPNFNILDDDNATLPWPGADNPGRYFDIQELFSLNDPNDIPVLDRFTSRLALVSTNLSSYNRYTFYRMLAQLGTDSVAPNREQLHLNYDNRLDIDPALAGQLPGPAVGFHATNFVHWTPIAFFTNTADRLLKTFYPPGNTNNPPISASNIPIWPTNFYSPTVHRLLQVAANLYDATTNRVLTPYPQLPSIFRPVFGTDPQVPGSVVIRGFTDISDINPAALWTLRPKDIDEGVRASVAPFDLVAGIPLIIGAKKGFPNFNEFAMQTVVQATRKLELGKTAPLARPSFTNQLYVLGISNLFGVEFWNSYTQAFARPLQLRARLETVMVLSNQFGILGATNLLRDVAPQTIDAATWVGREFRLPINTNLTFLEDAAFSLLNNAFIPVRNLRPNLGFESARGWPIPTWRLAITNRLQAMLVDTSVDRVVDYVNLDNLNSHIDITGLLFGEEDASGQSSVVGSFWRTNRINGIPQGVLRQVEASLGGIEVSDWNSASFDPIGGHDKEKAVDRFRQFVGLSSSLATPPPTLRMQAPFSPGRKLLQNKAWQVNDPLVHSTFWDLEDPARTNDVQYVKPVGRLIGPETHNLGQINRRYRPWDRGLYSSGDNTDFDIALKDSQITRSDDWDFPTNTFPNLGWIGRVHRGTPWQTIHLKSATAGLVPWTLWSGHPNQIYGPLNLVLPSTHPTNDWRILDLFTTAANDNAARGLLSVNQDHLAAWSAVLSGVVVLTNDLVSPTLYGPWVIEPNSPELKTIVNGINLTRTTRQSGRFNYLGEILSTPQLTVGSPFLRLTATQSGTPADAVVERIPQQILSLIKRDEPRYVIYAFGQSLRPAQGSAVVDPGPFNQMITNYTITGEYVTKTTLRLDTTVTNGTLVLKPVVESYNEVPPPE